MELVAEGLDLPTDVRFSPANGRMFVAEKRGTIRIVEHGVPLDPPYLDIYQRTEGEFPGGEAGLVGFAFHPQFAANGRFFITYTFGTCDYGGCLSRLSEFVAEPDASATVIDPSSERVLLEIDTPGPFHHGETVFFGPDGYLYYPVGDGECCCDPNENAQDLSSLMGKVLRLDVDDVDDDGPEPYGIPPDNPFVGDARAAPEIWAYGLRAPWRLSFDRLTNDYYLGDVGEADWEEINVVPAGSKSGLNFGWNICEGDQSTCNECSGAGFTFPLLTYSHEEGCAVIAGHVYRGAAMPWLYGTFLYTDFCWAWIRSFRFEDGAAQDQREWKDLDKLESPTTFAEDADGELYVNDMAHGTVYRFVQGQ